MEYEIIYSERSSKRILDLNVNLEDLSSRIQKIYDDKKDFRKLDVIDFSENYSDEKTWKSYLLVGKIIMANEKTLIQIDDFGILEKRSSDKKIKIYSMDEPSGGITLKQHIENLQKKTDS